SRISPSSRTFVTALSPRHAPGHCIFPVAAIEMANGECCEIDTVKATHIDIDLVGIGTRNVKRMNAARSAKSVLRDSGIESIGCQRILPADQLECFQRHDEMQKAFFATDRAIALGHPRQVRRHAKPHAAAMAA